MLPKRLLLTADSGADPAAGGGTVADPAATANGGTNGTAPSWYAPAESLKESHPEIWQSFENGIKSGAIKDWPSLVVKGLSAEKKLGTAVALPNKDKPEEVSAFTQKMIDAGILPKPPVVPESPDKYELKLDAIPEPMRSDKIVGKLRELAHKKGWTNADVADLIAFEAERYSEVVEPALKYTKEQGDAAIREFATSIGKDPEVVMAYAGAWLTKNFTEEEVKAMEKSGFADSPTAMKYAARAGLDTGEDISIIAGAGSPADHEFDSFMKNLNDPAHPDHLLYMKGRPEDPKRMALMQKREDLLKRKFGTGENK